MSRAAPTADDGTLIITFPRAWTGEHRLAFMADVARGLPRKRWAHVGERMCTDSIDATATERRAVFARLTARRAAGRTSRPWRSSSGWDERHATTRPRRSCTGVLTSTSKDHPA